MASAEARYWPVACWLPPVMIRAMHLRWRNGFDLLYRRTPINFMRFWSLRALGLASTTEKRPMQLGTNWPQLLTATFRKATWSSHDYDRIWRPRSIREHS